MEDKDTTTTSQLQRLLRQVQALAAEVRVIAERIHLETQEAHRLAGVARDELIRSRELSQSGRREAQQVQQQIDLGRDTPTATRTNGDNPGA